MDKAEYTGATSEHFTWGIWTRAQFILQKIRMEMIFLCIMPEVWNVLSGRCDVWKWPSAWPVPACKSEKNSGNHRGRSSFVSRRDNASHYSFSRMNFIFVWYYGVRFSFKLSSSSFDLLSFLGKFFVFWINCSLFSTIVLSFFRRSFKVSILLLIYGFDRGWYR